MTTTPSHSTDETITVRRLDLELDDSTPTLWFDDNVYLTALLTALAVSFPPGERYFIRSVRHFLPKVTDPKLREAIRAFVGQEANHTKEHLAFNRFLDERGLPATPMENFVSRRIQKVQESSTPEANLARTAALEHFTAILASALLENPEVPELMSPEVAKLWVWHAIEEIEHRAVAFDVYKTLVDDEGVRLRTMAVTTALFLIANVARTAILVKASGKRFDVKSAAQAIDVLWGRTGILRKIVPRYLAYYRRDFHPSQHDNREYVRRAKERYLGEVA